MTARERQREETRERILEAASGVFAERGFRAASTREIATRAGVNQGLLTYHFRSKLQLWKAAMDRIFGNLRALFELSDASTSPSAGREAAREAIRRYVRFVAARPELFRLMVEEGKHTDARMRWLVDAHLRPLYASFERFVTAQAPEIDRALLPHGYYVLAGAASLIFAVAPECRRLTGLQPLEAKAVEAHAEFLARILVPGDDGLERKVADD